MSHSILVVEDTHSIAVSLEFLMSQAGFDVRVVGDGDAALAAVEERIPDLILLDVLLPKGDGCDLCRTIRKNPAWSDVRIIMLTAKGRESEREAGMAAGADDYILKPFSNRMVVERVNRLLGIADSN